MAVPSWAQFGSGMPSDYCAYNASAQRVYKPQAVVDAERRLKEAKDELEALEKKLERLNCDDCESVVERAIRLTDPSNYDTYMAHLEGGSFCSTSPLVSSNIEVYNYYARIAGWETIEPRSVDLSADRMIAGSDAAGEGYAPHEEPVRLPPRPDEVELGGGSPVGGDEPGSAVPDPVLPAPNLCPRYAGPNYSLRPQICEDARARGLSSNEYRDCRRCVNPTRSKPGGRYGECLRESVMIEEQIVALEDRVLDLEDELEDAKADSAGDPVVCADCMKDPRSGWQRWGPMALMGGLTLAGAYFGYRQERKSYDHYRDVIHPDNNAKGYPTAPMLDRSGYRFASTLIGGLPMVINTGLASGAFGCSGSSMFGSGMIGAGMGAGSQMGGLMGVPTIFNGGLQGNAGVSMGGGLYNGNAGPWGAYPGMGGGIGGGLNGGFGGMNGGMGGGVYGGMGGNGGMMSSAQINAQIAQLNAYQSQLAQRAAWTNSYEAITQNYQSQVQALGAYPAGGSVFGAGGGMMGGGAGVMAPNSGAVLSGGVNIGAHLGMGVGGAPGMPSVSPPMRPGATGIGTIPTGVPTRGGAPAGMGTPFNPNVTPSPATQPGGSVANPLGF